MSSELGDFLRARRTDAALTPARTGPGRRRVSGLRREEVAAAAGISADYYTRLEQGRERHPSDAVLEALGVALRLTTDEVEHLGRLRDAEPARTRAEGPAATGSAARMQAIVDALRPHPAYLLDRLSNMVAANPEGLELYDGFADLEPRHRNTCRYLFTDPRAERIFVDWEEIARGAVMHLRAANVAESLDPDLRELVTELSARSPRFRVWWQEHIVERRRASVTRTRTRTGAVIARHYEVLQLPDEGLRLTLWLSNPESVR